MNAFFGTKEGGGGKDASSAGGDSGGGGDGDGGGHSVEYWNEQRAKLGLKPLKG